MSRRRRQRAFCVHDGKRRAHRSGGRRWDGRHRRRLGRRSEWRSRRSCRDGSRLWGVRVGLLCRHRDNAVAWPQHATTRTTSQRGSPERVETGACESRAPRRSPHQVRCGARPGGYVPPRKTDPPFEARDTVAVGPATEADCLAESERQSTSSPQLLIRGGPMSPPMRHLGSDSDSGDRWFGAWLIRWMVGCPDHRCRLGGCDRLRRAVQLARRCVVRRRERCRRSRVCPPSTASPRCLHATEQEPAKPSPLATLDA
jgi:hypothetical protein